MAVVYYVVKEGNYSATCLEADAKPSNPPDNCDLTVVDTGKIYKSIDGAWIPAGPIVLSNNRWVDNTGSDVFGLGDGTIINPFKTIQKAIDSITGASITNVFTINIGIGIFTENIVIKDGLSFVGLNKFGCDSVFDSTIISGDVIYHSIVPTEIGFANLTFEGSGNTISFSGSSSANTCVVDFKECKINTNFLATNNVNIVCDNICFANTLNNISFSNNSTFKSVLTMIKRGVDIDATSMFSHGILLDFDRSLSNILGDEIIRVNSRDILFESTTGLLSNNVKDALDELSITVGSGFGSGATTFLQTGLNTYTGGTILRPTINVSGLTIDNIFVSGSSNFNSTIGTGIISASTIINNVLTPKGTLITIGRDINNTITGMTKNNGILGIRNFTFNRNVENKISGWTVSV